jgi:maltooligosyltrehalose synthase
MFIIWKLLQMRSRLTDSTYEAIEAGPNVCAFKRGDFLIAVPRLITSLVNREHSLGDMGRRGLSRRRPVAQRFHRRRARRRNPLARVFEKFPVAVLERTSS